MPNFDKLFRDARFGDDFSPKGIGETNIRKSDSYYRDAKHPENTPDPLAKSARAANKPGSSIPSIFGRMMFFRTALKNAKVRGSNAAMPSVYDKIVSQWLDLLHGIFMRSHQYTFTPWNREEQLKNLSRTHKILHDALETQMDKYFGQHVKTIYIIKDKKTGKLLGATSPYTLVFASPKYSKDSEEPIVPLLSRDKKFKIFMYSLFTALKKNPNIPHKVEVKVHTHGVPSFVEEENPSWKMVDDLCSYLDRNFTEEDEELQAEVTNLGIDSLAKLRAQYSPIPADDNGIKNDVEIVNLDSVSVTSTGDINFEAGSLNLFARKESQIESDFFIDPDQDKVDVTDSLPMVLPNVVAPVDRVGPKYTQMRYIDEMFWSTDVLRDESYKLDNKAEERLELPAGRGIPYKWLSVASIMEEKLIELPYLMDDTMFENVINVVIPIDAKHEKRRSYLLPIKPKLLKYFSLNTVMNGRHGQGKGFAFTYDKEENSILCTLDIPVQDREGTKKTYVTVQREYKLDLAHEQVVSASPYDDYPVSVGITPFFQLPADNRYDVMLHTGKLHSDPVQKVHLSFYNGSESPLRREVKEFDTIEASLNVMQTLYKVMGTTFECLRVVFDCVRDGEVGGMVIPHWKKPNTKDKQIFYAIDFGTTNTHIAYVESGVEAKSFNETQLKNQVVYLAKKVNIADKQQFLSNHTNVDLDQACKYIYGDVSLPTQEEQARRFFPNFELDEFTFPIRTAAYGNAIDNEGRKELFQESGIGFNYPHESMKVFLEAYNTKLKWNLERSTEKSKYEALLFFKELLLMIRNHWMSIDNVDLSSKPHVALTFPLAMQSEGLMDIWKQAYSQTFNVPEQDAEQQYLIEVSESLAPAHKLISGGAYTSTGLLNVDIGGGTTDIQYYRVSGPRTLAFYNSEKFAGDDLWGCGRENMSVETTVTENVFTRFADTVMSGKSVQVGSTDKPYADLKDLKGKEKIGRLLRDANNNFANQVNHSTSMGRNTPALKVVFLHYSALVYHIAKWVMSDQRMQAKFPELINFSGFGSKYINILFGRKNREELTTFTKALLEQYGVEGLEKLEVKLEEINPKGITAEGAAIYAKNKIGSNDVITPTKAYYFGYVGCDPRKSPTYGEADSKEIFDKVMEAFDEYLQGFIKVQEECNFDIPALTPDEIKNFRENAKRSYQQVATDFLSGPASRKDTKALQSLFFWTLKDSLFNFDL